MSRKIRSKQVSDAGAAADHAAANTSDNLRKFMKAYSYSQADMARMLGVSGTMISLVLRSKYPARLRFAQPQPKSSSSKKVS